MTSRPFVLKGGSRTHDFLQLVFDTPGCGRQFIYYDTWQYDPATPIAATKDPKSHEQRLAALGLITIEKIGNRYAFYPTDTSAAMLDRLKPERLMKLLGLKSLEDKKKVVIAMSGLLMSGKGHPDVEGQFHRAILLVKELFPMHWPYIKREVQISTERLITED